MEFIRRKIRVGKRHLYGIDIKLCNNKLLIIKGDKGYIMCGYLNMKTANKFGDIAVKVVGVSNINDVLKSNVYDCSREAKRLGIYKGQAIKDVLKIIV